MLPSCRSPSWSAMMRALAFNSCNCESSAARPRFRPDSNAVSTRTLNQDSMERDRNCTDNRSEEHTSELQSLMRISYAVFCLKKKKIHQNHIDTHMTYPQA